jgi:hypothetical protein
MSAATVGPDAAAIAISATTPVMLAADVTAEKNRFMVVAPAT